MTATYFKVYTKDNEHIASTAYAGDAGMLANVNGIGTKVYYRYKTKSCLVWHEGEETTNSYESYDEVSNKINLRVAAWADARAQTSARARANALKQADPA